MNTNVKMRNMIMTALMMSVIIAMTMIVRIPIVATQGYIHLGDCMIFVGVLILGRKKGAVAAGVGSAMADILGGYAMYAPITLVVKFLMAFIAGLFIEKAMAKDGLSRGKKRAIQGMGMLLGGLVMTAGYYLAESVMYGSFAVPLAGVPMNILQFAIGGVLAAALGAALAKTSVSKVMYHGKL